MFFSSLIKFIYTRPYYTGVLVHTSIDVVIIVLLVKLSLFVIQCHCNFFSCMCYMLFFSSGLVLVFFSFLAAGITFYARSFLIYSSNTRCMISIRNIVKQYATHRALSDVSMEIEQGKVFGLLGPNGAGKTSLIRILNQITAPDSGEILFNGEHLTRKHIEHIGYMPEERGLYKKMEIGEQIIYLARLKGISRAEALRRAKYWFEKLEIQAWWNKKIEDLSKGMQQKAQFVATVLHEPSLLILDEPFSGFDPVNAQLIKNEILELNKKGTTIIFSTHRMESVEEMCDSIALLNLSRKILDGKVKEIKRSYRNSTYLLEYQGQRQNIAAEAPFQLLNEAATDEGQRITLRLKEGRRPNDALQYILPLATVAHFEELIPTMNEIFINMVNKQAS